MGFRGGNQGFTWHHGGPFCHGSLACTCKCAQQIACLVARNRLGNETNDKITRWQFRQCLSKAFTHAALDAVAIHRARKQALGDDHAQPWMPHLVGPRHHHQTIRSRTLVVGKHTVEISLADQPCVAEAGTRATRLFGAGVD
jgi:hypothetical protein